MASVSHTTRSPSTSTGTLPTGLMRPSVALNAESGSNESNRILVSWNGMPACFNSTQGRMDHDE